VRIERWGVELRKEKGQQEERGTSEAAAGGHGRWGKEEERVRL